MNALVQAESVVDNDIIIMIIIMGDAENR